jgi:uncharacterized protein (DUF1499 family)
MKYLISMLMAVSVWALGFGGLWAMPVTASMFHMAGDRPGNLGLTNGALAACPATPNCVSSQSADPAHQIAPLVGDLAAIKAIVVALPGSEIVTDEPGYLYAQFTSKLMGFVDDVEFAVIGDRVEVRSASRLGESDLGVNAKRVEAIRGLL